MTQVVSAIDANGLDARAAVLSSPAQGRDGPPNSPQFSSASFVMFLTMCGLSPRRRFLISSNNHKSRRSRIFFPPAHVLPLIALLMLILAENGRDLVDGPSGQFELAMIDRSELKGYCGNGAGLVRRLHVGNVNAYAAYALLTLLVALLIGVGFR